MSTPVEEVLITDDDERVVRGQLEDVSVVVTTPVKEVLVGDEGVVGGQLEDASVVVTIHLSKKFSFVMRE
jgi:hypothetical protein